MLPDPFANPSPNTEFTVFQGSLSNGSLHTTMHILLNKMMFLITSPIAHLSLVLSSSLLGSQVYDVNSYLLCQENCFSI